MMAYKFLARGALSPISGFVWPAPGVWVEAGLPLAVAERGVHVCRPHDLAHWLHDELWEVEVEGQHVEGLDCLVVERARLRRRVDAWSEGGASRFVAACIEHASALAEESDDDMVRGFLDDARQAATSGWLAFAAYCTASAVSRLEPGQDDAARERAFRRERAWQGDWLARELALSGPASSA